MCVDCNTDSFWKCVTIRAGDGGRAREVHYFTIHNSERGSLSFHQNTYIFNWHWFLFCNQKSFALSKIKWRMKSTSNWTRKRKSIVFYRARKKSIKIGRSTHYVQSNQSWEEILPLVNWQKKILYLTNQIAIHDLILERALHSELPIIRPDRK